MKIDCYMSLQCGSEGILKENVYAALALEGAKADVSFHRIDDKEAGRLGLKGSPSIFIDGEEVQPLNNITGFS